MTIIIDSAWMDGPQVSQSVQGKDLLSKKTKKVSRGKFIMSHHVYITWLLLATSPDPPRVSSQDKQTLFVSLTVLLMDLLMNGARTQGWMHMVICLHNLFLLPLENKWHSVRWRHHPPYPQELQRHRFKLFEHHLCPQNYQEGYQSQTRSSPLSCLIDTANRTANWRGQQTRTNNPRNVL